MSGAHAVLFAGACREAPSRSGSSRSRAVVAGLLLAIAVAAPAGAVAILNDGFESGDLAAWQFAAGDFASLHLIGRFDLSPPTPLRFTWPGSEIRTRFSGSSISVQLTESAPNRFDVFVDGVAQPLLSTLAGPQTYVLASGLAAGPHDLVLTRRSESFFGVTQLLGFPGATLIPTAAPTRRLELIGDSITCGYGVLGVGPSCSFSIDTEAETHAWGALAATALGAAHTSIAYSGKGVYRNYDGTTTDTMSTLWTRTLADNAASVWSFGWIPAAVVINLGTNDFAGGDPGTSFVNAMKALIAQVRLRYPNAEIVVTSSPMLDGSSHTQEVTYLQAAVAASGAHVSFLDIPAQSPVNGYGCDWHPSGTTQQLMANTLASYLHTLLGW